MKSLEEAARSVLVHPAPAGLLDLQGALLALERDDEAVAGALETTGQFYSYLCELQSKLAARDFSEFASRLDIGAVGAVALENIVAGKSQEFWQRLVLGGLGEGLMVAASRQYVRAWQVESGLVYTQAAWYLSRALWQMSSQTQPQLPPAARWEAIQALLAPVHDPKVPAQDKAALLGRIFQMLLITHLARLLPAA